MEEIGEEAFANSSVKRLLFDSASKLKKIGKGAFKGCALETLNIPSSVEIIDHGAFSRCLRLTFVEILTDSKLQNVDPEAFRGCSKLRTIESPIPIKIKATRLSRHCCIL